MATTHGMFGTRIYSTWSAMLYRCRNPSSAAYKHYGGRGVKVCDRWLTFENFHSDMVEGHWDGAEIDRTDPNGDYEPNNCRWVTSAENARNRRNATIVVYDGVSQNLARLCASMGVSRRHVQARLRRGWGVEDALRTPIRPKGNSRLQVANNSMTVLEAARAYGVTENALRGRLQRGWSVEKALGIHNKETT